MNCAKLKSNLRRVAIAGLCLGTTSVFAADVETRLAEQQKQINELKSMLEATASANESSSSSSWSDKVTLSGYGELHYNNLSGKNGASDKREIDFHRFVLFLGTQFNKNISFKSEFELEHSVAGESKNGEIELEQAYIDFKLGSQTSLKAGLFLMPIGLLNETHEPPTFYGVERNDVEKNIIPTTWWEAGIGLTGGVGETFSWDIAIHSGLNTDATSNYAIRSGRQKVSEAVAEDLAFTGRLKFSGIPGVTWALALQHQGDITQSADPTAGGATLIETDFVWTLKNFQLRGLYANWSLDGSGPESVGADEQEGFYLEPSYRINSKWGLFARFSTWDNQAGDNTESEKQTTHIGFNYWPHENVVIKFDVEQQDNNGNSERDGFNLGVGYQF